MYSPSLLPGGGHAFLNTWLCHLLIWCTTIILCTIMVYPAIWFWNDPCPKQIHMRISFEFFSTSSKWGNQHLYMSSDTSKSRHIMISLQSRCCRFFKSCFESFSRLATLTMIDTSTSEMLNRIIPTRSFEDPVINCRPIPALPLYSFTLRLRVTMHLEVCGHSLDVPVLF